MQENFSLIQDQINKLASAEIWKASDKRDQGFGKCYELIQSLISSANYMDYKKLVQFYEKWSDAVQKIQARLSNGENVASDEFKSNMESYIQGIFRRFPKVGKEEDKAESKHKEEKEELLSVDLDVSELEKRDKSDKDDEEKEELLSIDLDVSDLEKREESEEEEDISAIRLKDQGNENTTNSVVSADIFDEIDDVSSVSFAVDDIETPESSKEPVSSDPSFDYQGLFDELDDVFSATAESEDQEQESEPELDLYQDDLEKTLVSGADFHKEPSNAVLKPEATKKAVPKPSVEKTEYASEVIEEKEDLQVTAEDTVSTDMLTASSEIIEEKKADTEKHSDEAPERITAPEKRVKQTLRVDTGKIDSLMNQVGELVVSRAWFSQLYTEMRELQQHLQDNLGLDQREMKPVKALTFRISEATVALGRVANELQEGVMKVRMLPISQLFNRYPRLVRDLIHNTDKKVQLEVIGEETELDKMIIEEISDPLIHVIRNAVDHGCETAEDRKKAGKPEECTLKLESYHESNHVVIEITDDGRGIDPGIIKAKALEKNLFTSDELDRMSPREIIGIIMKPGFSTAAQVTRTSGRGVGMDVVKRNVEKLNGTIEIDSKPGEWSRFRIKIPLTLAIIRALLVRVGDQIFTIPLAAVEETLRIFEDNISLIEDVEVIHLRDSTLSLIRLSEVFHIKAKTQDAGKLFVVVVNTGMRRAGFVVDALIGQEETVIKPMVDYLQEKSGFSGATILGDGRISLILDVYELINMSIGKQSRRKNFMFSSDSTENVGELEAVA